MPDIEEIIDNFSVVDDWDDRYRYLIKIGRELPPLPEAAPARSGSTRMCGGMAPPGWS
jgi:cysteine desulfuration protein SufE